MLTDSAVPTIQLSPPHTQQDQSAVLNPTPRTAAVKRERKRLVADAVSSLRAPVSGEAILDTGSTEESLPSCSQPEQLQSSEEAHPLPNKTDKSE